MFSGQFNKEQMGDFLRQLADLADGKSGGFKSFESDLRDVPSRKTAAPMDAQLGASQKALEDHQKALASVNKGIAAFFPNMSKFIKAVKNTSDSLERVIRDQDDAHKQVSRSMYRYVKKMGTASEEFNAVQRELSAVQRSLQNVQQQVRKREDAEKRALNMVSDRLKVEAGHKATTQEILKAVEKELSESQDRYRKLSSRNKGRTKKERELLEENITELTKLRDTMTETAKKAASAMGELKSSVPKDKLSKLLDSLDADDKEGRELLQELIDITEDSDSAIVSRLDRMNSTLSAASTGATVRDKEQVAAILDTRRAIYHAMAGITKAVAVGLGDLARRELSMVQQRQMRQGRQFGMRIPSALMGMSEAEGLETLDSNRYLLRRMATMQEGVTGSTEFFTSAAFRNEFQQLGHVLGLTGKEAADAILGVAESMRKFGVDATQEQLSQTTMFLKESSKRFGITQDEMLKTFNSMSSDVALTLLGGSDNVMGSVDAINDEIEMRMRLARVLNQDVEEQKKRAEELARLRYGDPADALRQGVMATVLGQMTGAFSDDPEEARREQDLLRRTYMGTITEAERDESMALMARQRLHAGRTFATGSFGDRLVAHQLRGNLDPREVSQEFMQFGSELPRSTEEMMMLSGVLAETQEPIEELDTTVSALMRSMELLNGTMKSSIGTLVSGLALNTANLFSLYLQLKMLNLMRGTRGGLSIMPGGGGRLGRRPRPRSGRTPTGGGRVPAAGGAVAGLATVGLSGYGIHQMAQARDAGQISQDEFARFRNEEIAGTAGGLAGMLAGAKLGALGGGAIGGVAVPGVGAVPGAAIGAFIGGTAGFFGGDALARNTYELLADGGAPTDLTRSMTGALDARAASAFLSSAEGNEAVVKARDLTSLDKNYRNRILAAESEEERERLRAERAENRQRIDEQLSLIDQMRLGHREEIQNDPLFRALAPVQRGEEFRNAITLGGRTDSRFAQMLGGPLGPMMQMYSGIGNFGQTAINRRNMDGMISDLTEVSADGRLNEYGATELRAFIEAIERGTDATQHSELLEAIRETLEEMNEDGHESMLALKSQQSMQQARYLSNLSYESIRQSVHSLRSAESAMDNIGDVVSWD